MLPDVWSAILGFSGWSAARRREAADAEYGPRAIVDQLAARSVGFPFRRLVGFRMGAPTIFISYKREHPATTEYLRKIEPVLERNGFRILRDRNIEAGTNWSGELYRWLMECSGAVIILSRDANRSDWCRASGRFWQLVNQQHT